MKIQKVNLKKEQYLDLLYLGDENYDLIKKYISKSDMYIVKENEDIIGQICIKRISGKIFAIKNISILSKYQHKGYGAKLIKFIFEMYKKKTSIMIVGTGETKKSLDFYQSLGFKPVKRVKNYFFNNYDHEIYEDNKKLKDMIYLKKIL
ncbi:GNAT family N-acetyltransferase [Anaerofustis butyriciformans]|uniref:GNAT family N-acetyltransferase n=1 Tax=Anaerofustis butyriciformans TaxID=3108533 RepID=UPI003F8A98DB